MRWREYRELVAKFKEHDARFEIHVRRDRGSRRMVVHPDIDGVKGQYPIPYTA